jgi:2,4-dienoyl-CoA reductase-like NADH-dependent reductase (Old Yellow Enzyme family)
MAGESVEIVERGNGAAAPAKQRNRRSEPIKLGTLQLKNRILRSSMGGQMAAPDGSMTNAWKHFEKRFARTGVAGLVSATVSVDERRYSPLYYPKIANDRLIPSLTAAVSEIKKSQPDCAYILQIGDPGYHTQTSLFDQRADAKSASALVDMLYGYRSHSIELSTDEIARVVQNFANGARRVKEAGCDGVEITASKGYLIHQFLNPGVNRRRDAYGGTMEKRFQLLREIMGRVRDAVGPSYPVGVRISAEDVNYLPINVRLPPTWPLGDWIFGNGLAEARYFAKELEALGADWLHVSRATPRRAPATSPSTSCAASTTPPGTSPSRPGSARRSSTRSRASSSWRSSASAGARPSGRRRPSPPPSARRCRSRSSPTAASRTGSSSRTRWPRAATWCRWRARSSPTRTCSRSSRPGRSPRGPARSATAARCSP